MKGIKGIKISFTACIPVSSYRASRTGRLRSTVYHLLRLLPIRRGVRAGRGWLTRAELPAAARKSFLVRAVANLAAFWQDAFDLTVRTRDNMNADQLADTSGCGCASVRCSLDRKSVV